MRGYARNAMAVVALGGMVPGVWGAAAAGANTEATASGLVGDAPRGRASRFDPEPRIEAVFGSLDEGGAFADAEAELTVLVDSIASVAGKAEFKALVEADSARRYVAQLAGLEDERQARVVFARLRTAPAVWRAMELAVRGDEASAARSYAVLMELHGARARQVEAYPEVAAALAVVHDGEGPLVMRVNENRATSAGPVALLDYFTRNARRMQFPLDRMSADALAFVVDATASVDDLEWALSRYGNNPAPGDRFFEIDYDYDHFRYRKPKKVTQLGRFDLPGIKQYGGVCADQAYFADQVGKACGVPSVYVVARGTEVGHAWIGFLEARGSRGGWNLDNGRYEAYQNIRGTTRDPKTGRTLDDSDLAVVGSYFIAAEDDRRVAAAVIDAAVRWGATPPEIDETIVDEVGARRRQGPRDGSAEGRLDLLETGLRECPFDRSGWKAMAEIAGSGAMDRRTLDYWAKALHRMCGTRFPDFSVEILAKMFECAETPREHVELWDWAGRQYASRHDVAAEIAYRQGLIWMRAGEQDRAWAAFDDVVTRYAAKAPSVVSVVVTMESMLRAAGKESLILPMYEDVWSRVPKPDSGAAGDFIRGSNWYRVGAYYAAAAKKLGDRETEASVWTRLSIRG